MNIPKIKRQLRRFGIGSIFPIGFYWLPMTTRINIAREVMESYVRKGKGRRIYDNPEFNAFINTNRDEIFSLLQRHDERRNRL